MKEIRYNKEKNEMLKLKRGICFDEVCTIIKKEKVFKVINHPNQKKYPKQRIFLIKIKKYIYAIPFVEEDTYIFLKTVYPSHKYTIKYIK
ncbi:MAG: toxin [bacterium]|nr:toxin [bacterium]